MALNVDIEKKLGDFQLRSKFDAGDETLAILGASGCGKSMTLKCVAGVETPDSGRIVLDGDVLFDSARKINIPARLRRIGYLFQNYALFPNMTVEQNIACGIHKGKKEKAEIVREKAAAFYLNGLQKRYPGQLSGGQQQRVALARMLAGEPRLIMLDEPLSALDSFLRWRLEQEIVKLRKSFSGTVLFVSHNRDEVYRLCDRVVAMENGKTQEPAWKKDFFESPRTLSATLLSGCKNISAAKKTGEHSLFAVDWNLQLRSEHSVPDDLRHVGFRAHSFEAAEGPGGENTLSCDVTDVFEDIFSMIVIARVQGGDPGNDRCEIRLELGKEQWAKLGQPKKLYLKMPKEKLILIR